jgi:TRAP-type C4-dicarboxylate transport system substrate-binding protein
MKNRILLVFLAIMLAVSLVLFGACSTPEVKETIELTYGHTESSENTLSEPDHLWIDKIQKDTNGQVHITTYWGGTLISKEEGFAELVKGVADIAFISVRKDFPLYLGSAAWGFGVPDRPTVMKVWGDLWEKFPEFDAEFSAVKLLGRVAVGNYHLMSREPIRTIEDFDGLKVRTTGVYAQIFKALGGEGISIPISDTYVAFQKGTVDAVCVPYDAMGAFHLYEVAKYATILDLQASIRPSRGINWDSYNSLPSDIQKKFDGLYDFITEADNSARDAGDARAVDILKQEGVEVIQLSAEDRAKLYEVVDDVMFAEAGKLDAEGLPGTEIYKELRSLVDKYTK